MSDSDVLIKVDGVGKKFCRDLKRSLWYGVKDLAAEVTGQPGERDNLRRDEFWAVDDVSFEVRRGECLGLIGHNGAGKSTLLKMLNGLIKPDRGSITMRGRIGALIELGAGFNPILTGRENIYVNGSVLGMTKKEIDRKFDAILDFAEIGDFIDAPVQTYSSGMKVRLGFAVAAQLEPDILLIDEVLAVGDVGFRMKCFRHMVELSSNGTSMILVSHNMTDINRICGRGVVMGGGHLMLDGEVPAAVAAYQGSRRRETSDNVSAGDSVTIINIKVLSDSGCDEISTGDAVSVSIVVAATKPRRVRARIALEGPYGHLAGMSSAAEDVWFDLQRGENQITLVLDRLPLLVGGYSVSCGIYGEQYDEVLCLRDHAATLNVTGPRLKSFAMGNDGLVILPHRWSVEAAN